MKYITIDRFALNPTGVGDIIIDVDSIAMLRKEATPQGPMVVFVAGGAQNGLIFIDEKVRDHYFEHIKSLLQPTSAPRIIASLGGKQ